MTTRATALLVGVLVALGCSSNSSAPSQPALAKSAAPVKTSPTPTTKPPAKLRTGPNGSYAGLIKISALATLPQGTRKPTTGYPGKSFRLGLIKDAVTWQAFLAKANVSPFANQDYKPNFATDVVVFAVLDAQTNALGFKSWSIDASGKATLTVDWSGIEPFYADATPAVLVGVPRAGIKTIDLASQHGPVVSHTPVL